MFRLLGLIAIVLLALYFPLATYVITDDVIADALISTTFFSTVSITLLK